MTLYSSLGIPKRFEDFLFFNIGNAEEFKIDLKQLIPAITTTQNIKDTRGQISALKNQGTDSLLKVVAINIAFTSSGLKKVRILFTILIV